jgi:uncharacterized protein (UPF0333 family)
MDNRAQLSLELIIVVAAIIAISFIMFKTLSGNASDASDRLEKDTDKILDEIEKLIK